jgi:transcriptional regulator
MRSLRRRNDGRDIFVTNLGYRLRDLSPEVRLAMVDSVEVPVNTLSVVPGYARASESTCAGGVGVLTSVTEVFMTKPRDLLQGTLDVLLLKILALEPLHGWAIAQRLKQVSGDVLQVSEGSLYPALHKLEHEGWITAKWEVGETGRRSKRYSLSRAGRRALERESANWERLSEAISHVLRLKEV